MATQKVTVELPQAIFQQLARIANATQQPLETLAAQSIVSNLPPTPDNAPVEIQEELLQMQIWDLEELLAIANSQITSEQQKRHTELLEKNSTVEELNKSERQELSELRIKADRLMLQKAYAWSVLRWRGHKIPNLNEMPL
ncbi:MAG: hypothetical protein HC836_39750 [Richelia sp. RM2_1_2]|nr:hypothetical protein [Richelia sp. SM1_7_0]NJN11444.1 hypothetical protein [Richelia sp. RM1_1_1]NJO30270.1 hypothetical protein [Richelia sp. SL_2_1]NJO64099.1 hypothetical protein [Richelia sp. RM2_1_2]